MISVPVVLLALLIGAVLLPRTLRARAALADARAKFFETTMNIRNLEVLHQRLAAIDENALRALFVPAGRPLAFIEMLETFARQSGSAIEIVFLARETPAPTPVRVRSEENEPSTEPAPAVNREEPRAVVPEQRIEIRLRGTFTGALQFLSALQRQSLVLRVEEVLSQMVQERGEVAPRVNTVVRIAAPLPQ